jgi:uncharacterized protein YcbK (DUF882 family)
MSKSIIHSIENNEDRFIATRRGFLKTVTGISLLTLNGIDSLNAAVRSPPAQKTIALNHFHTGDKLRLTYFEQGNYIDDALQEINYLMRDYHNNAVHIIDPALLDQLYDLKLLLGINNKSFIVTSGYRTPRTNEQLRKKYRNVAKQSLHMQGRAIDLHVDGLETRKIRNAALTMKRGGVGYCRRGNFVHLDTGSFRSWLS